MTKPSATATWQPAKVASPRLAKPVGVIAAKGIPYRENGNRLQTVNLYRPATPETTALVGTRVEALPSGGSKARLPRTYVHVHGGAWRDPQLTATSIEAAVAHAFSEPAEVAPIEAIASIDYTLTHFPTHPTLPYDVATAKHADPAREAVHPRHVDDVLHALAFLRSLGLEDGSYILSGHSCGACLAFQAILRPPGAWSSHAAEPPCPTAMFALNGLYDLPALVTGLGSTHAHLGDVYEMLLSNAFGSHADLRQAASPARFEAAGISARLRDGRAPPLVLLDQSAEDQLVPMNQLDRLATNLSRVKGMRVVRGRRCKGPHAAPWEQGVIIKDSLCDVLELLRGDARGSVQGEET